MALNVQTAFLVAVLIAVLILAGYLEWSYARGRLMRRRKTKLEASSFKDEAFNSSVTSKAIMRNLKSQGFDVRKAEQLIMQSDAELEMGSYASAKLLADDAKKALFEARSRGLQNEQKPVMVKTVKQRVVQREQEEAGQQDESEQPKQQTKLPRNYAEASFTMKSVELGLTKVREAGQTNQEAEKLLADAHRAYDDSDYDAALRIAVKASRSLSGNGEAASSIQSIPPQEKVPEEEGVCKNCGAVLVEGDSFCRKCGSRIAHACPSCGEELQKGDTFCGKCGSKAAP